ncbi:amidohydrolase family protein [Achromobacter sp. GG226]|uniref:amidohydrolase family protein n=1 Tax=Verticiella alkaliphila TaxID=2779529 RepID=UPI001C0AF143|nr:amidohydrolase family protein [Verticiella sp. GG226]MBU4612672.1 amidohydrolase family protein [Verticiella sp. GG226]
MTATPIADCRPPHPTPSLPAQRPPQGSWDCHCHVFGPHDRFPYDAQRRYTPPDAPAERLIALHRHLGFEHAVLVQAACHGFDHAALLDAIVASEGRYRGVALLPDDADDALVRRLHAGGVRAARLNFVRHLGEPPSVAQLHATAARIAPFGWHLCLHIDGEGLLEWLPELRRLPLPFVVDHVARVQSAGGVDQPAMRALLALADLPNAWVKVSAIDRVAAGVWPYHAGLPFVQAVLQAMPDRTLWGTDWPHPNIQGDMPDDGQLVDLFAQACPDAGIRRRVLVDNPKVLYD